MTWLTRFTVFIDTVCVVVFQWWIVRLDIKCGIAHSIYLPVCVHREKEVRSIYNSITNYIFGIPTRGTICPSGVRHTQSCDNTHIKGHLLCKIHFFMSFLHKHVSPLCKEILKVSGKKICSLFVLIHLYKNLSENELIRFWPLYDVITIFWLV